MQPLIKKLFRFYLIALIMVLLYFLIKTFMPEENPLQTKSFPTVKENQPTTSKEKQEIESAQDESQEKFILLPQK